MQKINTFERGYTQLYTGNGKGKTTAALGLGIRALGAGLRVYIAQFLKGRDTSELNFFKQMKQIGYPIEIEQCGSPDFVYDLPSESVKQSTAEQIRKIHELFSLCHCNEQGRCTCPYDVFILDEAIVCCTIIGMSEKDVLKDSDINKVGVQHEIDDEIQKKQILEQSGIELDLLELIRIKPKHVELILTGRGASNQLIEASDLVTEMCEVKHYYNTQKVTARIGIEI
ncbi:MAG: putative cobinamide adenolsyltransferase [Streblomastix strix]|uniref:Putative cobinamide adenolsyltransferase n=1 Tax=Streblomastix strix TaxID=222440 RepID=A0A5J4WLR5_9EUKA|nr:MAG: putative cobinamide adenolsyltransferase [Streblomastix strix]